MILRRIAREPLVLFSAFGLAIFGLHRVVAGPTRDAAIVVDGAWVAAMAAELTRAAGRPPGAEELSAALEDAADEERLYREGLALGLDREDPIVRRRVIQKTRFLAEDRGAARPVEDAELAAWLDAHPERYRAPARVAITQVFVAGERHADPEGEARRLLAALSGGAAPEGLGDPSPHGQRLRLRPLAALADMFGAEFAAAVEPLDVGRWSPAPGRGGWHVVRVDDREPERLPALSELRPRLQADLLESRRREAARAALEALRRRYPLVVEEAPSPGAER